MADTPTSDGEVSRGSAGTITEALAEEQERITGVPAETPQPPPPQPATPVPEVPPPAPPPAAATPANALADKFGGDVEKLNAAYAELERKQSQKIGENPLLIQKPTEPEPSAGTLDFQALAQEVIANGELSEESVKLVAASGLPQNVITQHVNGIHAQRELALQSLNAIAGGPEEFAKIQQWAAVNLSEGDLNIFNEEMQTGRRDRMDYAMNSLVARYRSTGAGQQSFVEGVASGLPSGAQPFKNAREMRDAMNTTEYLRGDKDVHAALEKRLQMSDPNLL